MNGCKVDGCTERTRLKRGWCEFHYGRWLKHGDPLAGGPRRAKPNSLGKCLCEGCSKDAVGLGYCTKHYSKFKTYGDPNGGWSQDGRSKKWHTRKGGYVIKFDRSSPHANAISGIVFQHREVMGEAIGRPLRSDESVHHKNGDRSDNRLENLELWIVGQPAGQSVNDQVGWARRILSEYGDLADKML